MNYPVDYSLKRYKGKWTNEQVTHLLKRTMFGANVKDVKYFTTLSLRKSIELLIDSPATVPSPPVNAYNDEKMTDEEVPAGQTWVNALKQDGMRAARRKASTRIWWMGVMLNQQRSIQEKMVLFWHNHFATEMNLVDNGMFLYKHNVLLREHALGNFKAMVRAVTYDPTMLKYLNGNNNVKKAPDENYGRELQELFTVGKGPGSHYTEGDVKAAARVLTGIRIDNKVLPESHGYFDPNRHDEGDKQFSAFYNNTIIKGRKGKDGEQELDDMLDMIFAQEEVSKFICRKLYRFFVYHGIDDTTEKNIITPLAATFRKNNYEIRPVLTELFSSRHFFDPAIRGGMIKSPIDLVVGLCREYEVTFPTEEDYTGQYQLWQSMQVQTAQMQQSAGDPPNVAGWQAYYQEPLFDKMWVNTDTLPKRNLFTDKMINGGYSRNSKKVVIDPFILANELPAPSNPDALIADSVKVLYMVDLPDKEKKYMKEEILLSGLKGMNSDHYWTDAWNKLSSNPEDAANKKDVTNKLKKLYQYLMNLPQYQLC